MRACQVAAVALAFFFIACVSPPVPPLGASLSTANLEADEQALWKESKELQYKIEVSGLLFDDPEIDRYVAQVLERVTPPDLRAAGLTPRVEIISDVNIHGYSFANGVIYIHTALLSKMQNETQLATLLSRELAHVTQRHALMARRTKRTQADTLAWIGVGASMVEGGGGGKLLVQAASMTSAAGFAHNLETTADRRGLEILDAAGYAVGGTPAFYEMTLGVLSEIHSQGPWAWAAFTPPPQISARIAGMKSLLAASYASQTASRAPILDTKDFRRKIHPATLRQAELEMAAGLFVSAETTARLATESRPRDPQAWVLLGRALAGQRTKPALKGRALPSIGKVRDAYQEALGLDRRHAEATREMGMSFYRTTGSSRSKEDAKEAHRYLRAYLRLAPRAGDAEYVKAYLEELEGELR